MQRCTCNNYKYATHPLSTGHSLVNCSGWTSSVSLVKLATNTLAVNKVLQRGPCKSQTNGSVARKGGSCDGGEFWDRGWDCPLLGQCGSNCCGSGAESGENSSEIYKHIPPPLNYSHYKINKNPLFGIPGRGPKGDWSGRVACGKVRCNEGRGRQGGFRVGQVTIRLYPHTGQ